MEIEIKYQITDRRVFAELLRLPGLAHFELRQVTDLDHLCTTYYDTPDIRLAAQRCGLRIRETRTQRIATVKRSLGTADGLHTREEWETPIDALDHPLYWPHSPARTQALELLGDRLLVACCRVETRRQYVTALLDAVPLAELCLDEGTINAARRVLGFRELEIELLDAEQHDAFHELIALIRERFGLLPENRGRRTRGLMLLRRVGGQCLPPLERTAEA